MSKITVLGAGVWGTALSYLLDLNGHKVTIWDAFEDVLNNLKKFKEHKNLKGFKLDSENIYFEKDLLKAISQCEYLITVIPAQFYENLWKKIANHLNTDIIIVNCSKGIIVKNTQLISEQFFDLFPDFPKENFVGLSGPSYAVEVCQQQPTAVVAAGQNTTIIEKVQELFSNSWFRVYANNDLIGVELAGAVKNVIAIASGILNGIGLGSNASAALITRGNAELMKLNQALKGDPKTLYGLAGIGDLILTATSSKSRNFSFGKLIGEGCSVSSAKEKIKMVVEGIETVKSTKQLALKHDIEMPIVSGVYDIIFNDAKPESVIKKLMQRSLKKEF